MAPRSPEYFFTGVYTSDDSGKFKTLVIFDCRGLEPIEFQPKSGWIVESEENGIMPITI